MADFNAAMLEDFEAYHADLKHVIEIAENVTCWPLSIHDPLPSWTKGKMVLVGDAAHPVSSCLEVSFLPEKNKSSLVAGAEHSNKENRQMLPFGGQGSNQAIEDAGALGLVLASVNDPAEVSARLKVFENVRINRVSIIQTLSMVRAGNEKNVEEALKKYYPPGAKIPGSFPERNWDAFR